MLDKKVPNKIEEFRQILLVLFILLSLVPFPAGADFVDLTVLSDISGKVAKPENLVEFSFTVDLRKVISYITNEDILHL